MRTLQGPRANRKMLQATSDLVGTAQGLLLRNHFSSSTVALSSETKIQQYLLQLQLAVVLTVAVAIALYGSRLLLIRPPSSYGTKIVAREEHLGIVISYNEDTLGSTETVL